MKTCILCGMESNRTVFEDERLVAIQCLGCGLVRQLDYGAALAKAHGAAVEGEKYYYKHETKIAEVPSKVVRTSDMLEKIESELRPKAPVLDVGCGNGEFMNALQERGLRVVGVEPNLRKTQYARKRYSLNVVNALYTEGLFSPESFDVITFIQVLEHVENPIEILAGAHKHLRQGGYLVIEVPGYHNPRFLLYRMTKRQAIVKRDFIPTHNYYYTRKTLCKVVERVGFHVLEATTGRYRIKYGQRNRLLSLLLSPVDLVANSLGVGGVTLYAHKD